MIMKHGAIALAVLAGACSKETTMPDQPETLVQSFLLLNSADGQSSVRLDALITLVFAKSLDRAVVERGFHLISEKAMADSLCPVSSTKDHGNMMSAMADSVTMDHIDRNHTTPGRFLWNADSTGCTFKPDSLLSPQTLYMIHMDRAMTQMMERRVGSMGMTEGHATGMMSGEMMFHFSTIDTTASGSGHDGHD